MTEGELQDLLIASYDRMMVKVTSQREKYIAVANRSGKKNTHPSWFLHIYQEHTGSVICAPFGHSSVREKDTEIPEPVFPADGYAGGGQIHDEAESVRGIVKEKGESSVSDPVSGGQGL